MCFRPAVVKNICPKCGKDNFPGVKECIECGAELDGGHELGSQAAALASPASPAAAGPQASGVPNAPAAPAAPSAPKEG